MDFLRMYFVEEKYGDLFCRACAKEYAKTNSEFRAKMNDMDKYLKARGEKARRYK